MDKSVVNATLKNNGCIGCGICKTVCLSGAIKMQYNEYKEYIPVIATKNCSNCGICAKFCPNSLDKRIEQVEKLQMAEDKIAYGMDNAYGYFVCKANDMDKLLKSASGGFVTSFAAYLLQKGEIDCVLHAQRRLAKKGEEHYAAAISTTTDELYERSSSIYGQICFADKIESFKGTAKHILVIGTPCVISGLKKLFTEHKDYKNNRIYTIALSRSHNVNGQFVDFIGEIYGVEGEYSANLRAKIAQMIDHNQYYISYNDSKGKDLFLKERHAIYFTPIWRSYCFAMESCTSCPDFWGADADVSTKDAWGVLGANERYGKSIVIFRDKHLMSLFEQMKGMNISRVEFAAVRDCQIATVKYKQDDIISRFNKEPNEIEGNAEYKTHIKNLRETKQIYKDKGAEEIKRLYAQPLMDKLNTAEQVSKPPILKRVLRKVWHLGLRVVHKCGLYNWIMPPFIHIKRAIRYNKKKYNKVIMLGTFNQINAGDEAQIDSTIKLMKDRYPQYLIEILSHVPKYTYDNHYNCLVAPNPRISIWDHDEDVEGYYNMEKRSLRWRFLLRGYWACFNAYLVRGGMPTLFLSAKRAALLEDLKTSDLIYFSGGGAMTGATLSRCWDFMFSMKLAKIFHVPCVMSGQNSGLWGSKFTEHFVAKTLKYASAITLRDPYAVDNLKEIGIEGEHVFTMFDDALFCDKLDDVSEYLNEFGIGEDKYTALNLHYWGIENSNTEQELVLKRLGEFCDYIIEKTGTKILLVPMASVDAQPMEDFIKAYPNEMVKTARFSEYDFRIIRGLFAKAQYCVTMKHHPIIFSIGECVPTISIAYKPYYVYKNAGALEILGLGKYSLDLEHDTYMDEFKMLFDEISENRDEMSAQIGEMLEGLKERRERLFRIIDGILK